MQLATTLGYHFPVISRSSNTVGWSFTTYFVPTTARRNPSWWAPPLKVGETTGSNATSVDYDPFEQHYRQLRAFAAGSSGCGPDMEPPSDQSVAWAQAVLQKLEADSVLPTRVVASAEGGVAICFVSGDTYSDIEILNSGQLLAVTTDRVSRPVVWEIEPNARDIARASARIQAFVDANKTEKNAKEWASPRYRFSLLSQTLPTL